jgi:hypothetical protein
MITDQLIFRNNHWEGFDRLKAPGGDYQLLLVFAEKSHLSNPSMHEKLRVHFPAAKIVASSTAGEITGRESLENAALVIALKLEQTPFKVVYQNISTAKDSHDLGIVLMS